MKLQRPLLFSSLTLLLTLPASALAGECEADQPATPVPQFTAEAPGVSLWPIDPDTGDIRLRPANTPEGATRDQLSPLPQERDSTDFLTQTAPGEYSGHELFLDVGVPNQRDEDVGQSEWLVVAYNSGIEVWSLEDPEQPNLTQQLDGWPEPYGPGEWANFAVFGEIPEELVTDVDVVQVGDTIYIGAAGFLHDVGFSAWTLDPIDGSLTQVYQDTNVVSLEVSLVADPNGEVYAFSANGADKIGVYDLSAAAGQALCVDEDGANDCGVYRGQLGAIQNGKDVSARVIDGKVYVAATVGPNNTGRHLVLWQVSDPADPATATLRYEGVGPHTHSPQLFEYRDHAYLASIDSGENFGEGAQMYIHEIAHCLDDDGCEDLGAPRATENLLNSSTLAYAFDLSFSAGVPFLHLGMRGFGPERVWNLSQLPETFAADTLPELTDGGGSYADPCSGEQVDYFGDYMPYNEYGLRLFRPHHAIFTGPYLYRAGHSVLDVHVRSLDDCGDGVVQQNEECDDGNRDDGDGCTSNCEALIECGDGNVQPGEECDDGNNVDDDGCTNACTLPTCGDGVVQAGEECDDPDDPGCVDCMLAGGSESGGETDGGGDELGTGDGAEGGATDDLNDGCNCDSGGSGGGPLALGLIALLGLLRTRSRPRQARSS